MNKEWKNWIILIAVFIIVLAVFYTTFVDNPPIKSKPLVTSQSYSNFSSSDSDCRVMMFKILNDSDEFSELNLVLIKDKRKEGNGKAMLIDYNTSAKTQLSITSEISFISFVYIGLIEEGCDIDDLFIFLEDDGELVGGSYVLKEWKDDYLEGKLSDWELAEKILESAKELDKRDIW